MSVLENSNETIISWLNNLQFSTETECMSILQGKSIIKNQIIIKKESFKDKIILFYKECCILCEDIERSLSFIDMNDYQTKLKNLDEHFKKFSRHVKEFKMNYDKTLQDIKKIDINLIRLKSLVESLNKSLHKESIIEYTDAIKLSLFEIQDVITSFLIKELLSENRVTTNIDHESKLKDIYYLSIHSNYFISYLIMHGAIEYCLEILQLKETSKDHLLSLQILSILCSAKEAILQFDNLLGLQCLSTNLCNDCLTDEVRLGTIKLLSVITNPSTSHGLVFTGYLELLQDIVTSLINFTLESKTNDRLSICNIAIINLMKLDDITQDVICDLDFIARFVSFSKSFKDFHLETKNQIYTILKILSLNEAAIIDMVNNEELLGYLINDLICFDSYSEHLNLQTMLIIISIINEFLKFSDHLKPLIRDQIGSHTIIKICDTNLDLKKNNDIITILNLLDYKSSNNFENETLV